MLVRREPIAYICNQKKTGKLGETAGRLSPVSNYQF